MSVSLPNLNGTDLSAAQVGTSKEILLGIRTRPVSLTAGDGSRIYPQIVFNNESGCGLTLNFRGSSRQVMLPAGAWTKPIPVMDNDTAIDLYVNYVLPNQPVASLFTVLYWPKEVPLEAVALGNSPIGISGNVSTSNVQSVTNDGQAPETTFIEATPSDQSTSSVVIRNTASGFLQVLSANVLRKIINVVRGNAGSGKATIDIGDAGDLSITTFHGTLDAAVTIAGSQVTGDIAAGQIGPGTVDADVNIPAANVQPGTFATGNFTVQGNAATTVLTVDGENPGPNSSTNQDLVALTRNGPTGTRTIVLGIDGTGSFYIHDSTAGADIVNRLIGDGNHNIFVNRSGGGGNPGHTFWEGISQPSGGEVGDGDIWANG